MNAEKKLEGQIAAYAAIAKDNKNIDVVALMASAFEQQRRDEVDAKKKRRAYLVSILLPPFGLIYAFRWYFSGKTDGKRVARYCVVFTIGGLLIGWLIGSAMVGNTMIGSLDQIEQVNIEDIRSLLE